MMMLTFIMVDFEEHLEPNLECEEHEDSEEYLGEEFTYGKEGTYLASR